MVRSDSGSTPHLVTVSKDCQYKCDDRSPQHKSLAICSHTVEAAELSGELRKFFEWYCRNQGKRHVSITQLETHGMLTSAGHKGGRAAKKARSSVQLKDENCVPLRCSQAFVIGVTGNTGTQIVNTASTEMAETRVTLSGVISSTPIASSTSYHSLTPEPPYPPLHGLTYHYSPWFYSLSSSIPPFYGPQYSLPSPYTPLPPFADNSSGACRSQSTFTPCFKTGNISVCSGCRTNLTQLDDLVGQTCRVSYA